MWGEIMHLFLNLWENFRKGMDNIAKSLRNRLKLHGFKILCTKQTIYQIILYS